MLLGKRAAGRREARKGHISRQTGYDSIPSDSISPYLVARKDEGRWKNRSGRSCEQQPFSVAVVAALGPSLDFMRRR